MKKKIACILVWIGFSLTGHTQQAAIKYPTIDFLGAQQKISCWTGPLTGTTKVIPELPMMTYFDRTKGRGKIIAYPKYGVKKWQQIVDASSTNKQFNLVREISKNRKEQEKYLLYAFFMEMKYLQTLEEQSTFPGEKDFAVPGYLYVYRKEGQAWKGLSRVWIKTWDEFVDLQIYTVLKHVEIPARK